MPCNIVRPRQLLLRASKAYLQLESLIPQELRTALQDVNEDIVTASLDLDEALLDQLLGYEISRLQQYLGPRCYYKLRKPSAPVQRKTSSFRLVEGSIISVPRNTATTDTVASIYNSNHERMLDMLHLAIPRHADQNIVGKVGEVETNKHAISKLFTFCSYPFLLNPQTKLNILLYELGYMIRCSRQSRSSASTLRGRPLQETSWRISCPLQLKNYLTSGSPRSTGFCLEDPSEFSSRERRP